jgi:hypothetical protein
MEDVGVVGVRILLGEDEAGCGGVCSHLPYMSAG